MVESVMIRILWSDGQISEGVDATDLLSHLLGGWNPDTMTELKHRLAQRANIDDQRDDESDYDFLVRLDSANLFTLQIVSNV